MGSCSLDERRCCCGERVNILFSFCISSSGQDIFELLHLTNAAMRTEGEGESMDGMLLFSSSSDAGCRHFPLSRIGVTV
jgi:hypothetical protein